MFFSTFENRGLNFVSFILDNQRNLDYFGTDLLILVLPYRRRQRREDILDGSL